MSETRFAIDCDKCGREHDARMVCSTPPLPAGGEALRSEFERAEPVREREAIEALKDAGYVVIHRSAWEFMRDDPHPEQRNWNSPIGAPIEEGEDG